MNDLAEIGVESQFAKAIWDYFIQEAPAVIIETGLYHGTGSTKLIASIIKKLDLTNSKFYSIECNPKFIDIAKSNLYDDELLDYVQIENGLSIPKEWLPSKWSIDQEIKNAQEKKMTVDHELVDSGMYEQETVVFCEDNILGRLFEKHPLRIEFILLDSAGHTGIVEFMYVTSLLKHKCCIALDDTKHLKHYRSLETMKSDRRFKIIHESDEKFGSAMAIFTP